MSDFDQWLYLMLAVLAVGFLWMIASALFHILRVLEQRKP